MTRLYRLRLEDGRRRWAVGSAADGPDRLLKYGVGLDGLLASEDLPSIIHSSMDESPLGQHYTVLAPVESQEVWAAGVTYLRSRDARKEEAEDGGDVYSRVYDAARPELFFKAPGWRACGPNMPVAVRADSEWNVPEPELTLVISRRGDIIGYTIGNDVSSRSIEGENPLYLPQAKVYDGSCALGPCILLATEPTPKFRISIALRRDGEDIYQDSTSTTLLSRSFGELRDYLFRALTFPTGVLLMTGTSLVPPASITLLSGDTTSIVVSEIGVLENSVELTGGTGH